METICIPPPLGELDGEDPESLLLSILIGQEVWLCSVRKGEEEEEDEGGDSWNIEGGAAWFSLGGTGGNNPPGSDRDELRLGLVLSTGPCRLLGVRSEVDALPGMGVSPEVEPSNKVKHMDSWESLLGGGGAGSGTEQ